MLSGDSVKVENGYERQESADSATIKDGQAWQVQLEGEIIAKSEGWPVFRSVDAFGGGTFIMKAKIKMATVMLQLGNDQSIFPKLGSSDLKGYVMQGIWNKSMRQS